jgi:hypothetical protein
MRRKASFHPRPEWLEVQYDLDYIQVKILDKAFHRHWARICSIRGKYLYTVKGYRYYSVYLLDYPDYKAGKNEI